MCVQAGASRSYISTLPRLKMAIRILGGALNPPPFSLQSLQENSDVCGEPATHAAHLPQ